MHPSDVGTSLGSGMGGTESLAKKSELSYYSTFFIILYFFSKLHKHYCRLGQFIIDVVKWSCQDSRWWLVSCPFLAFDLILIQC
jgi:hypothetical protein